MSSLSCASTSKAAPPEIIVWPHWESGRLHVARETTQPFYIMAYKRGAQLSNASEVEITVPAHWQVWRGSDAPPATNETAPAGRQLKYSLPLQTTGDTANSRDYSPRNSAGNLLMVARPLPQADEGSLQLRWLQGDKVVAERKVALSPLKLQWPMPRANAQSLTAGMWLNDPKFHDETMAEVYRGLRHSGIDYVIITSKMYRQSKDVLRELGMKALIAQWWGFRDYVPVEFVPPEAAYSTLRDGSIDRKRWSPTYMAEGGPEFIKAVTAVADELKGMDGVYGLMLDYEPGIPGIEADYGAQSRKAFEKYLGQPVAAWPADVLPKGKHEEAWINFRVDQSEAYIHWFQKIMKERAPHLKLAVTTSGATLTSDDINRRLAVTDITQFSRVSDTIHPQLYSWTDKLPEELERFNDKLKLGQTTIAGSKSKVFPVVGSGGGKKPASKPEYLRTQLLNWWFHGSSGLEIWQYFYGVDGQYMEMVNELAHLFEIAGDKPQSSPTADSILAVQSSDTLEVLSRTSADGKTAWVGLFNFSAKPVKVPLTTKQGWQLSKEQSDSITIAPWSTYVAKCLPGNP